MLKRYVHWNKVHKVYFWTNTWKILLIAIRLQPPKKHSIIPWRNVTLQHTVQMYPADARGFLTLHAPTQDRRQKVFSREAIRLCRGAWHSKNWHNSTDCVLYVNLGARSFVLGPGTKPIKTPWWRDCPYISGGKSLQRYFPYW